MSVLSGGERARAVLAGLVNGGHNLLVLDEPTNHLDIPSAERLEDTLRRYTTQQQAYSTAGNQSHAGTLILITHDRMLLDNLVDQLLVFDGSGNCSHFLGTYSEWLAQQKNTPPSPQGHAASAALAPPQKTTPKPKPQKPSKNKPNKKTNPKNKKNSKEKTNTKASAASKLSQTKLESEIERLENRLQEIDFALMDPEVFADGEKIKTLQTQRQQAQEQLKPLEKEWANRAG